MSQQTIHMITAFKTYTPLTLDKTIDEYTCPSLIQEPRNNLLTTQACELKSEGRGCLFLKKCPSYKRHKDLERQHGDLTKLPLEKQKEIEMIINQIIIPPNKEP